MSLSGAHTSVPTERPDDPHFGSGTEASVAIPLTGAFVVLTIGYLVVRWIWRKLGEPQPDPVELPAEWRDEH
jgi:hypothetical protein